MARGLEMERRQLVKEVRTLGSKLTKLERVEVKSKSVDETWREEKEYLSQVIETMPDAIAIISLDGSIHQVNHEFEIGSGWKRQEVVGKTPVELGIMSKEEGDRIEKEIIPKLITEGSVRNIETVAIRKDGTKFPVLMSWALMKDAKGKPKHIISTARDITDRKKAEDALRLMQFAVDRASDMAYRIDPKGRIVYVNKAASRLLGYSRKELLSMSLHDIAPEFPPEAWADHGRNLRQQRSMIFESQGRTKDGHVFPVEVAANYVEFEGKEYNIAFVRDITERKQVGKKIQRLNEELEQRVTERTAELRKTHKQLLQEIAEHKQAEQQTLIYQKKLRHLASQLSLAEESQRRWIATDLHDHVNQGLALSMIKLQSLRKSAHSVDAGLLDTVCETISNIIENVHGLTFDLSSPTLYKFGLEAAISELLEEQFQGNHEITYKFSDDKAPKPLDDNIRVLLFQSIRELLINIIKHAKAHKVLVAVGKNDDNIQITVIDDGVGFDVDHIEPMTHKTGGFGLFNICERLDYISGSFDIQSQPGKGSRLVLSAPLKTETDLPKEKSDGNKDSTG